MQMESDVECVAVGLRCAFAAVMSGRYCTSLTPSNRHMCVCVCVCAILRLIFFFSAHYIGRCVG